MRDWQGYSKGCGIVEFETAADAQRAILEMNNKDLNGRLIFCREDRDDYKINGGAGRGASNRGRGRGFSRGFGRGRGNFGGRGFRGGAVHAFGRGGGRGGFYGGTGGRGGRGGGAPFYAHNGGGGGYHTAQPDFGGSLLKVGNLPFSSTAQDLRNMFSEFGELTGAKIFYSQGRSIGTGLVGFVDDAMAQAALAALNGTGVYGRELEIRRWQENPPSQSQP